MTAAGVYALLADGTTVEIRPAGPDDFAAVKAMHAAMSPDNTYMRFFNMSRLAAETEARRVARLPEPGRAALLALLNAPGAGPDVVGVASYALENDPDKPNEQAEIAFAVAENMHHRGIATLLLEHLVSYARAHGITTFVAHTLTENKAMLNVFADAGLPVTRRYIEGTYELTFPLPDAGAGTALDSYLNATAERERRAEAASLRHVLAPESVVVIGASRSPGTAGRAILDNLQCCWVRRPAVRGQRPRGPGRYQGRRPDQPGPSRGPARARGPGRDRGAGPGGPRRGGGVRHSRGAGARGDHR